MNFEVNRSSWAHIALCADLTWATEPPDEYIIANQRLWAQHCRASQVLQESSQDSQSSQYEAENKRSITSQSQENGSSSRKSVKDVIPESRLAQYYGNFYYDEVREKCYTSSNERINFRGCNGQGCENTDLTECWMLPEVEYWFRKLLDDPDRNMFPRRRRQFRMLPDDDLCLYWHRSAASERWGPNTAQGEVATLAARVSSVRGLWNPRNASRTHSPPPTSRKIRPRRRQPRRITPLASSPPSYCLQIPAQLLSNPACKFNSPRPPQLIERQRAKGRITASVAAIKASTFRCPPYRGTNVSRYAPTGQRPARGQDRRNVWLSKDQPPRVEYKQLAQNSKPQPKEEQKQIERKESLKESEALAEVEIPTSQEKPNSPKEKIVDDGQQPSTSTAAMDAELRTKRLYSTVLSMSAPTPINLTPAGCVRLAQKLATPGILKLNPKIVLPGARVRPPNVDHKFEELEKQALEQYKASDESIDTKFQELEQQAEDQYSNSNSNTSCGSEKKLSNTPSDTDSKTKWAKFHKEKPVFVYSQNFPLSTKQTSSVMNLKNFHGPPRGDKKERNLSKSRLKLESQRAASDTDYEVRDTSVKNHKGPMRWSLHVIPPKKRHLTSCVSDFSSDEEMEQASGAIKDARPRVKNHKMKLSAHGGGDLHPYMRKA